MPGNEEKDILLSVGIDISSLNAAKQQIIDTFSGISVPVGITSSHITAEAQKIRQEITNTLASQPINIPATLTDPTKDLKKKLRKTKEANNDVADSYKQAQAANQEFIRKANTERSKFEAERVNEIKKSERQILKEAEERINEISNLEHKRMERDGQFGLRQYSQEQKLRLENIKRDANERSKIEKDLSVQKQQEWGQDLKTQTDAQKEIANNSWSNFIKRANAEAALNKKNRDADFESQIKNSNEYFKTQAANIKERGILETKLADKIRSTKESLDSYQTIKTGKLTPLESTKLASIGSQLSALSQIEGRSNRVLESDIKKIAALKGQLKELQNQVKLREILANQAKHSETAERGLLETTGHIFKRAILWSSVFTIAYGAIRTLQNVAGEIVTQFLDIDEAVVILKRDLNIAEKDMASTLGTALYAAESTAVKYSKSIKDVILIQDKFAKQGLSITDILKATEATLIGSATAMITTADAAQILSTTMLTFKVSASETISVFDKLNEVSKKFNITAKDLGTALQHTGGAAQQAGLTIDNTIGLITVIAEATGRAGAEIGNAVRTMSSFVYRPDTVKGLAAVGVAVMNADRSFRTMDEIIGTLARRWNVLTDAEQQNVIQLLAGTLRREQLLAIMNNYPRYLSASSVALGSFTSALDEMSEVMKTVNFHGGQLRAAMGELAVSFQEMGAVSFFNTTLEWLSSTIDSLALSLRNVSSQVKELRAEVQSSGAEFIQNTSATWKVETGQIQTLLFIQKTLRNNQQITAKTWPDILLQLAKIGGLSDELATKLVNTKDNYKEALIGVAESMGNTAIPAMQSGIDKQTELNSQIQETIVKTDSYLQRGRELYNIQKQLMENKLPKEDLAALGQKYAELSKLSPDIRPGGLKPSEQNLLASALESLRTAESQGINVRKEATFVTAIATEAQKHLREEIEDIKPKIEFTSKAIDAYNRKIAEAKTISEQTRDMSKSVFALKQEYVKTLLSDTDAKIIGLKAELDDLDRKKKEDLNRKIDTDAEKTQREGITAAIAEATRHQSELNDLLREMQGITFDLQHNTDILVAKSRPLQNLFGSKLQANLDIYTSELSVIEGQLKQIQQINDSASFSSEDDVKLLELRNSLEERRLGIETEILRVKALQFEESLRIRKSVLQGLTQEQALTAEINRLSASKEIGPAVERAKELIDYQYAKAERLSNSISESISQGLTDAMLAAPGESDDAFRNMFKGIFAELAKEELLSQIKSLVGQSGLINVNDGATVANLIHTAFTQGGTEAANAMSIALTSQGLNYTPGTGGISGVKVGGLTSNQAAIGSLFALSAMSSYSASQKKEIENAWAPMIGTVVGGVIGSYFGQTITGMAVGGALGGLFVKEKKSPTPVDVKDPAMDVLHRDLEFVNRNLIALRKPLELFALPASYYFSQKPASGVQVQGVVINIGSTDTGPDAITAAVADGMLSASKKLYQGV